MGEGAALTFLGTADSKGVPRWWCACPVCQEARQGGRNRRTRSAALLEAGGQTALLDCGPDLHAQLARLGRPLMPDAVLISHAHNDHLLGLGDLLDYVAYAGGRLPVYAPASVLPQIEERFRYAFRRAAPVQPLPVEGLSVCGYRVRAFEVPHGANGTSHAFHFERPGHRWVYLTDSIDVPQEVVERWLTGLDLLVLGSSFFDESGVVHSTRSVYDVREALQLPWAQAVGEVWLTHLSHDVDVTGPLPDPRYRYASEGQTLALQQ
ncbi:MBL fold metallo-hydrolase [Deinococcus sonorensis]|uniref:MBL fold metallo-hydrolase n=2 Tax=Deinococcus sonorensis TaxID=309891 RepID=A0AAU7U8I5_9DEIO